MDYSAKLDKAVIEDFKARLDDQEKKILEITDRNDLLEKVCREQEE